MSPRSASSTGTTVRAVIRRPDGTEQVGRLGTLDSGTAVKSMSATVLGVAWSRALWTLGTDVDLRPSASDWITVWTNPAVTVATNYVGEKTVDWSWRSRCFTPGLPCVGAEQMTFSAALLRGEVTWDAAHEEFLAVIGTNDRAALLAFDARQIAGQIAYPRYQRVADVEVDVVPGAPEVTWRPCVDPADFEVLAETVVPLSGGDSFVLQYGVQSDGSCSAQHPGLLVGTTTPGCFSHAQVLVDRLSGTLLMDSSATSVACTRG
jgi:hypothetical protein